MLVLAPEVRLDGGGEGPEVSEAVEMSPDPFGIDIQVAVDEEVAQPGGSPDARLPESLEQTDPAVDLTETAPH